MSETVIIDPRFNGFPGLAHGGYVSGVVSRSIGTPARVTLRAPPPLGKPLLMRPGKGGGVELTENGRVVAKGQPADLEMEVPEPVGFEAAVAASRRFPSDSRSPSPTCLCCGYLRTEGEGLRILPGPLSGREAVAAPWVPDRAFGTGGVVRSEFVWAALDCPGAWGLRLRYPEGNRRLTVRMAARQTAPIRVGEPYVVLGWPIDRRRRLFECGSAVFGLDGDLRAFGRALWMETSHGGGTDGQSKGR